SGFVCLWNASQLSTATPSCQLVSDGERIETIEWNPNETQAQFATGSADGLVNVWNIPQPGASFGFTSIKTFQASDNGIRDMSWHQIPNLLVTTDGDSGGNGRLKVWQMPEGTLVNNWAINDPNAIAWRSTGRYVGSVENGGAIRVVDSESQLGFA